MKATLTAIIATVSLVFTLTGCGGDSGNEPGSSGPAASKPDGASSSYTQDKFIEDVRAAGWDPTNPAYLRPDEEYFYTEAVRYCEEQKTGKNPNSLTFLESQFRHNREVGLESASADVDALMAAVKKTCGLK